MIDNNLCDLIGNMASKYVHLGGGGREEYAFCLRRDSPRVPEEVQGTVIILSIKWETLCGNLTSSCRDM